MMLLQSLSFTLALLMCEGLDLQGPIDLSWSYNDTAKFCPLEQDFQFLNKFRSNDGIWYSWNTFAVHEHCGTHIDAPYHFDPEGITVENIPVEKLLVTGVFIDVSEETGDDANYTMPLSKVKDWERANGPLPDNSVVLIRLGWASRYHDKDHYYFNLNNGTVYRYPGIAPEVSHYLVDSKKVVGVGVDSVSPDPGYDVAAGNFTSHVILLKAGLYILENVAILSDMPPIFKLIVAPMKIAGGTGGPTRLIAFPIDFQF